MKSITQVVQNLIKPYIDSHDRTAEAIIAPVETDATSASDDYAIGKQLILNNVLYDVIAPITAGDALVVNTNIKAADNVSSDIVALTKKLEDEAATRSALGAKNILPFDLDDIKALNTNGTWAGNVYTYRGVAFTVNSDGTISATGTATGGNASLKLFAASSNYEMLGKEVILTGCPSGGSASTYRIQAYRMASADGSTGTYFDDGAGTDAFTVLNNASGTVGSFAVAVYENATVTNLLFKPMVRLASDPDDTYQPYAKTNQELTAENQTLTNNVSDINTALGNEVATRAKVSGHNLLSNEGIATSTDQGITYTKQSDGGVVANGTATNWAYYNINSRFLLEAGTYILSGKQAKSGTQIKLMNADTSADVALLADNNTEITFTLAADTNIHAMVYVGTAAGEVIDFVFKPMIRLATDANSDYEPYSMTNQELTPIAQAVSNRNLLDNPWFTVNQRGASSYSTNGGYTVDRWRNWSTEGEVITVNSDNSLTLTKSATDKTLNITQVIEESVGELLVGKTVTLSAMLGDGTVKSVSGIVEKSNSFVIRISIDDTTKTSLDFYRYSDVWNARIISWAGGTSAPGSITIKAIKLELGSVSTLAQDTAPNYQQELAKCQRYFVRLNKNANAWPLLHSFVYALNANDDYIATSGYITLPVPMRAVPSITYPDIQHFAFIDYADGTLVHHPFEDTRSNITIGQMDNLFILPLRILTYGTQLASQVQLNQMLLVVAEASTYIDLSADL